MHIGAMTDRPKIIYARENDLDVATFRAALVESGLGDWRPVDDADRLRRMLSGANLVITARLDMPDGPVVGVARCITDFTFCCYLSDLAVARSAQGLGVGRGLVDETRRQLGPDVSLILAALPDAVGFYERIGMPRLPDAFWYRRER